MRVAGQDKAAAADGRRSVHYKWIALSNTTLGILMVTINQSILLISLPDLFRGINLNPLVPSNTSYFLWVFLGFLLVTAVLVVSLGRVGDIYGRVRMYNLGFAVFTLFSILLSVTWLTGPAGALWIIIMRVFQGVGGAFLFANSTAILTDAFPPDERGKAMGINGIAAVAGSFLGLILGGVLAPIEWRLVFLVSVPFGLFGTIWAYLMLRDNGIRIPAKIDWLGNTLFAVGLIAMLTGIVYSLLPYGGHPTGWTNPWVLAGVFGGIAVLVLFTWVETKVPEPMFRLGLFRVRAFTAGNIAGLLGALGRGGMQFMLIIWLQGCRSTARASPRPRCGQAFPWSRSRSGSSSSARWRGRCPTGSGPGCSPLPACSSPEPASCCSSCCRSISATSGSRCSSSCSRSAWGCSSPPTRPRS
jgi:MFS family permease